MSLIAALSPPSPPSFERLMPFPLLVAAPLTATGDTRPPWNGLEWQNKAGRAIHQSQEQTTMRRSSVQQRSHTAFIVSFASIANVSTWRPTFRDLERSVVYMIVTTAFQLQAGQGRFVKTTACMKRIYPASRFRCPLICQVPPSLSLMQRGRARLPSR